METEVKVGWFAFAGGNFSPYPNAYPNCQGVVAWVNSDPNAPEGERGLIVTPDEVESPWTCAECYTGVTNDEDGKQNTRLLLDYGRKHGLRFQAAEFCNLYCRNGVKQGEAFLPAKNQLQKIVENVKIVNRSLSLIAGIMLGGWTWSSSEYDDGDAWGIDIYDDGEYDYGKNGPKYVRCVLAF